MKTLVMYGEAFLLKKMVPITSEYGHTVISFGIGVMEPVYDLYSKLLEEKWSVSKNSLQIQTLDNRYHHLPAEYCIQLCTVNRTV